MAEEHFSAASRAPFSIVAISALLWSQGGIWAALGVGSLYFSARVPAADLISAVLFGFAALSCVLAVLLHRRERARIWVIAQETFVTFVGLAILGTWVFALDGYYLIAPIGLFVAAGIFMSACAVADLLSGSARDYCHRRAALTIAVVPRRAAMLLEVIMLSRLHCAAFGHESAGRRSNAWFRAG
jgi:hypothetical protein